MSQALSIRFQPPEHLSGPARDLLALLRCTADSEPIVRHDEMIEPLALPPSPVQAQLNARALRHRLRTLERERALKSVDGTATWIITDRMSLNLDLRGADRPQHRRHRPGQGPDRLRPARSVPAGGSLHGDHRVPSDKYGGSQMGAGDGRSHPEQSEISEPADQDADGRGHVHVPPAAPGAEDDLLRHATPAIEVRLNLRNVVGVTVTQVAIVSKAPGVRTFAAHPAAHLNSAGDAWLRWVGRRSPSRARNRSYDRIGHQGALMRIVLDLQAIQSPPNRSRGIGRACRSLVREIILQRGDHEILVVISGLLYDYAEEIWEQLSDVLPIDNFHVWHGIADVSWHQARQRDVWAYQRRINTILYQAFLAGLNPDVVLFGNFCDGYNDACLLPVPAGAYEIPVVMICYDLIPLVYPQLYDDRSGNGFIDFYRLHLAHLKNADHIFAISDSVRNDIVQFLDYPAADVTMTSLGFTKLPGETLTSSRVQDVCQKYNIKKPFILYVSAQDPRKNHVGVIEAFARLEPHVRDAYQIVFAGSNFIDHGRLSNAIQENDLPQSVLSIAVHPSDEDLQVLYKLAHLGIFPSLYEGFGLGIFGIHGLRASRDRLEHQRDAGSDGT